MQTKKQKSKKEVVRVHNAWAIYKSEDPNQPGFAEAARPQDWGDHKRWKYYKFIFQWITTSGDLTGGTLEVIKKKIIYINHCHIWTEEEIQPGDVPLKYAELINSILMPGQPRQYCSNKYLREGDFWQDDWGKLPKYYEDNNGHADSFYNWYFQNGMSQHIIAGGTPQ